MGEIIDNNQKFVITIGKVKVRALNVIINASLIENLSVTK
jgi:hypothetical protein